MPQDGELAEDEGAPTSPALAVEMIPAPLFRENLRHHLKPGQWNACKRYARERSGGHCAVCGEVGPRYPVDCHERWEYLEDQEPRVLRLAGLIALCPPCHAVVHFGQTERVGGGPDARAQLARVNGWSGPQVDTHIDEAFARWSRRSRHEWIVDLRWVTETLGLVLDRPTDLDHRLADRPHEGEDNPFPSGTQEHAEHDLYLERLAWRD